MNSKILFGFLKITEDGKFYIVDSIGNEIKEILPKRATGNSVQITFSIQKKKFRFTAKHLVAEAFLGEKKNKKSVIQHRDGNVLNLAVSNLYYGERKRLKTFSEDPHFETLRKYRMSIQGRYHHVKNSAKRGNKEFNITIEKYEELIKKGCNYCGKDILNISKSGGGLDRIDSNKGYIEGNIIPCCGNCNRIKCHLLSKQEMEIAMDAILKLRKNQSFNWEE